MRWLLFAVAFSLPACGAEDPPAEVVPAALELGTGSWRFEALTDGQEVELVHGAQGGWHIWISLRVTGAELDHPEVTLTMQPADESRPAQETHLPLAFDPPDEHGARKLIGFTGIINDPSCIVGKLVRVQASVSTGGEVLTDEHDVVVLGGAYPPPPCEAP